MEWLNIKKIQEVWDPYEANIWPALSTPITYEEVYEAIPYAEVLKKIPTPSKDFYDKSSRSRHILKIAWLVTHWEDGHPIHIDVGMDDQYFSVDDGNHRLAAAIYRCHTYIEAEVSGAIYKIKRFKR
jgi:hypothetical protein